MDLKEFVAETLAQIAEGVAQASDRAAAAGAVVNPQQHRASGGWQLATQDVEFTVALTVNEGTSTKGGIGVVTGIFALGSQGQSNEARGSTTHIKFRVPLTLPPQKNS